MQPPATPCGTPCLGHQWRQLWLCVGLHANEGDISAGLATAVSSSALRVPQPHRGVVAGTGHHHQATRQRRHCQRHSGDTAVMSHHRDWRRSPSAAPLSAASYSRRTVASSLPLATSKRPGKGDTASDTTVTTRHCPTCCSPSAAPLCCCAVALLRCCAVALLHCCTVALLRLRCCLLRCCGCGVAVLRCCLLRCCHIINFNAVTYY